MEALNLQWFAWMAGGFAPTAWVVELARWLGMDGRLEHAPGQVLACRSAGALGRPRPVRRGLARTAGRLQAPPRAVYGRQARHRPLIFAHGLIAAGARCPCGEGDL